MGICVVAAVRLLAAGLFLLLAEIPSSAYAAPVVHQPTGISFPDEIAGFARDRVEDYESKAPGLGFGYHYRTTTGAFASVYVYTVGISNVPASIDHPVMGKLREQTVREILQFAQSRSEAAQHTLQETIKVKTDSGEVPVLFDGFIVNSPGGARNTFVWLWTSRGHFLKVRVTRVPAGDLDPGQLREFYESIVRLSAAPAGR